MPSATTAESSDSIEPSSVKDSAAGSTAMIRSSDSSGRRGMGSDDGMPPNFVPMVAIGRSRSAVTNAAAPTAISMPGQCGRTRRRPTITAMVPSDSATAAGVMVARAAQSAGSFSSSSPGSSVRLRPSNSRIWLAKMITAMPAVKPTVTGKGMNLMKVPSRSSPASAIISPDRKVARISPSMPCRATVAATRTMNAPAGPPIWNREPPRNDTRNPPTMAV